MIDYGTAIDGAVFVAPYLIALVPASSASSSAALAVHLASDVVGPVQTLAVPPPLDTPSLAPADRPAKQLGHVVRLLTGPPLASTGGGKPSPALFVSSAPNSTSSTVWALSMRPWEAQLDDMERHGDYAGALGLLEGRSEGDIQLSDKPARRTRLRVLRAVVDSFIARHAYDEAIDTFIELDTTPAKVVSLFPPKIAGRLARADAAAREEAFGGRKAATVGAALTAPALSAKDAADESKPSSLEAMPAFASPPVKPATPTRRSTAQMRVRDDDAASIRSGHSRGSGGGGHARQASVDEVALAAMDFRRSIEALIRYLTDRRQHVNRALAALRPSVRPTTRSHIDPPPSADELLALPDKPLSSLSPDQLHRVAQVVDTALFKCYLATKPGLLGPLCRLDNWCEIDEVEGLLLEAKRYHELLDLYNGKDAHEKSLRLLRRCVPMPSARLTE